VNGRSAEELARIAVDGRASVIQLREKQMPMDELLPIARKIRHICQDITFIVNDRVDLAKITDADGVHLGQDDIPIHYARELLGDSSIIGISCGLVEEAKQAEFDGADYIGFGHMYPTSSKVKNSNPKTIEELREVCSSVKIPVIAIGGITADRARSIAKYPIGGVAIFSAFSNAQDPLSLIKSMRDYEF